MTDGFSGENFQKIVRTARALRGKPQSSFGQIDALQTDRPECVADSHDGHRHNKAYSKHGLGDDKLADKVDLQNQKDRESLKHGLANLRFFRCPQNKALRLFPQLVHDPVTPLELTLYLCTVDAREHPKGAIQ